jgi:peptide deformylase
VHFLDENGIPRELRAEGLLSRAFQHEMDHLSGVLIVDYMNPVKKLLLKSKLKRKKFKTIQNP